MIHCPKCGHGSCATKFRCAIDPANDEFQCLSMDCGHKFKRYDGAPKPLMPADTKEQIDAYVRYSRPVGHFLTAVLSNDLREAIARADLHNQAALVEIVKYVWRTAPFDAWGTPERVRKWLAHNENEE